MPKNICVYHRNSSSRFFGGNSKVIKNLEEMLPVVVECGEQMEQLPICKELP